MAKIFTFNFNLYYSDRKDVKREKEKYKNKIIINYKI